MLKSLPLRALARVLPALVLTGAPAAASAQNYPTRTVRIMVPASPGGGSDLQARLLGKRFSDTMGQGFVVDNRPGASGVIGAELVARAPADGYTLLVATAQIPMNLLLLKKAPFDMVRDLAPVTQLSFAPQFLMVHPSVPARSLPELIALAKKSPGKLNGGSGGNGSANHLAIEMLKLSAGINVTHVPYRGGGPSIAALISGETDFSFSGAVTAMPQIRSGKVRALAVTSPKRSPVTPDLPTIGSFFPGYDSSNWYAMFVPAGTPFAIINKLHGESVAALKTPEIRDFMLGEGAEPVGGTPAELGTYLKREIERYANVIKVAKIKGD